MILGVGTDIIEIDRIKRAMDNTSGFLERIFTDKEIEVFRDNLGKPVVNVSENVRKLIKAKDYLFNVSISHNKTMAIAFVVLEECQST